VVTSLLVYQSTRVRTFWVLFLISEMFSLSLALYFNIDTEQQRFNHVQKHTKCHYAVLFYSPEYNLNT